MKVTINIDDDVWQVIQEDSRFRELSTDEVINQYLHKVAGRRSDVLNLFQLNLPKILHLPDTMTASNADTVQLEFAM